MATYKSFCPSCPWGCQAAENAAAANANYVRCPEYTYRYEGIIYNIFMYKVVPPGMKQATIEDIAPNGKLKVGLQMLVKSFFHDNLHSRHITQHTELANLIPFIISGKCYIKC